MTPAYWSQAVVALQQDDAVMRRLIAAYPTSRLKSRGKPLETLLRAIVGQQISVKAADTIWARLQAATMLDAQALLSLSTTVLRGLGLSQRKAEYFHAVCTYFAEKPRDYAYFAALSDAEIIAELTTIHGIGRWSAEMFLIFTLLRPNVFPVDDIGLLRALERHYPPHQRLMPAQARRMFQQRFNPWCSVATWYLWRSLDPNEIQY